MSTRREEKAVNARCVYLLTCPESCGALSVLGCTRRPNPVSFRPNFLGSSPLCWGSPGRGGWLARGEDSWREEASKPTLTSLLLPSLSPACLLRERGQDCGEGRGSNVWLGSR